MRKIKKKLREHFTPITVILLILLVVYAVSLLMPFAWSVISAFKKQSEFRLNPIGLPRDWIWNFSVIFDKCTVPVQTEQGDVYVGMVQMYFYAFLYAFGCAFFNTLVPCVVAYLCARFRYKFSKIIYFIVIVTLALPIVGALPAEIKVAKFFGFYDHIWGLWIMKANFLGMYFLVFYNIFKNIPMAYTEAAKIDGAGNSIILWKIIMPLQYNTFLTVMLINFISFWNDYQIPLVYLPSYPTIAYGMYYLAMTTNNELANVPMRMAGSILMVVPILILFFCFQKRLMGNLTMGGLKG